MATKDISRSAFDARKHYTSVRMQQGRVIVDDDWNENERIRSEDQRRGRVDVIGPAGSPDSGFRIPSASVAGGQIDFVIEKGVFYLGGLRLEMEHNQTYLTPRDYLEAKSVQHPAPSNDRIDLVYLEAFQEPVGAVEDEELLEVALGGPDTSMRIRTRQRVHLLEGVPNRCDQAWRQLAATLKGKLNDENELEPDSRLTVTFAPGGNPGDLCKPHAAGGYLGAENQAIRVQLVDEDHLTWGFDNAAPLYRVQIDANRKKITLKTGPKDQAHWPLAGQIVEILPCAAKLPNGEWVAATQGHLSPVAMSYDPDKECFELTSQIPASELAGWLARVGAANLSDPNLYFFMRVWDRGADLTSSAKIAFTAGTPVTLGKTGVKVTITGNQRIAGDYWIIAVRPEAPQEVVPWELAQGRRPHGLRRFYAPLALIRWKAGGGGVTAELTDCRHTFRPLTRQKVCCTITVGDGKTSHGDFDSLETALRHLPPRGGQICLLPGNHRANVTIQDARDIKIAGCDKHTLVMPRAEQIGEPILQVIDSHSITLEHMDLIAVGGTAIRLESSAEGKLREVEIGHNRILAGENGISVDGGQEINIHHNRIRILDKDGAGVGIALRAEGSLIERNDISVVPAEQEPSDVPPGTEGGSPVDPCADLEQFYYDLQYLVIYFNLMWSYDWIAPPANPFKALGGIQIARGSDRVRILENKVRGGAGNGVTLGSRADLVEEAQEDTQPALARSDGHLRGFARSASGRPLRGVSVSFRNTADESIHTTVTAEHGYFDVKAPPGDYEVMATGHRVVAADTRRAESIARPATWNTISLAEKEQEEEVDLFLYDIQIEGNYIWGMGRSGIGAPSLTAQDIEWLKKFAGGASSPLVRTLGVGALGGYAVNLEICRNHIAGCLQNNFDSQMRVEVRLRGMGGISLGLCRNLIVHGNRIEDNGRDHVEPVCGIFISYADQADICHNQIVNNGPLVASAGTDLERGYRGGVLLALATSLPILDLLGVSHSPATTFDRQRYNVREAGNPTPAYVEYTPAAVNVSSSLLSGRQAARVHDNIIEQPVGRALTITALGPVSVVNNQFNTDFPGTEGADIVAGTVAILNLGQYPSAGAYLALPSGNILFSNNQICLTYARCLFSLAVSTKDDLVFRGNQSDVLGGLVLPCNTLLQSLTVRASDNRFKEIGVSMPLSLFSGGMTRVRESGARLLQLSLLSISFIMNNTTDNQGDHCIVAVNAYPQKPAIDTGNQTLLPADCRALLKAVETLLATVARVITM